MKWSRIGIAAIVAVCTCFTGAVAVQAATWIGVVDITGSASPGFDPVFSFTPPSGTVPAGQQTVIRLLIDASPVTGFRFQLYPDPAWPPTALTVGTTTAGVVEDDNGDTVASAVAIEAVAGAHTGYTIVQITILYQSGYNLGSAPAAWTIYVEQQASTRQYSGHYATGTSAVAAAATSGQLVLDPETLDFQGVHIGLTSNIAPVLMANYQNLGTAQLTVSSVTNSNQTDFDDESNLPAGALLPGQGVTSTYVDGTGATGIAVLCKPTTLGSRSGALLVNSDANDVSLALQCVGVQLYAHLLYDCSGSMGYDLAGNWNVDETDSRMYLAKQASIPILEWMKDFSAGEAYVGLSSFSGSTGTVVESIAQLTPAHHTNVGSHFAKVAAGGLSPSGLTPMAPGIEAAFGDMDPPPVSSSQLRQMILMLSDGAANVPGDEDEAAAAARNWATDLKNHDIRMYTIGLGDPTGTEVDWDLLQDLSSGTDGEFVEANTDDEDAIANAFKTAVKDWLGLRTIVDPTGQIKLGESKEHAACVDDADYGLTFVVRWSTAVADNQQGISLTLTTPDGVTITPTTRDVTYKHGNTFSMYILQGKWVRGGQGHGQWTMHLTGDSGLSSTVNTSYSYDVLAQSAMKIEPNFKLDHIWVGNPYLLEVALEGVSPKRVGQVTIDYDYPAESFTEWLCKTPVDADLIRSPRMRSDGDDNERVGWTGLVPDAMAKGTDDRHAGNIKRTAPDRILGEPATLAQKKAWVLTHVLNTPFKNERTTGSVTLYDDGTHGDAVANDLIYSNYAPALAKDGMYNFRVGLAGIKTSKLCLQGELFVDRFVSARLSASLAAQQIKWGSVSNTSFFDDELLHTLEQAAPNGMERRMVRFTPQGESGTLWGLGHAGEITFTCRECDLVGGVQDNLDGSYSQVVQYAKRASPQVAVSAQGISSWDVPMKAGTGMPWYMWLVLVMFIVMLFLIVRVTKNIPN